MSNCKEIYIEYTLPFHAGDNDELLKKLGQFSLPSVGVNIDYIGPAAPESNEHGGITYMDKFVLSGMEALSFPYINHFIELVEEVGGSVNKSTMAINDLEAYG